MATWEEKLTLFMRRIRTPYPNNYVRKATPLSLETSRMDSPLPGSKGA